jgi:quinoprotein glucose dehydrogenase
MIRVLAITTALLCATATWAQTPAKPGGDFVDAPEKALVAQTCTACHIAAQVTGQKRSKDEWKTVVEKMIGFGAQVPDDKFDEIVGYLASHYGS